MRKLALGIKRSRSTRCSLADSEWASSKCSIRGNDHCRTYQVEQHPCIDCRRTSISSRPLEMFGSPVVADHKFHIGGSLS